MSRSRARLGIAREFQQYVGVGAKREWPLLEHRRRRSYEETLRLAYATASNTVRTTLTAFPLADGLTMLAVGRIN